MPSGETGFAVQAAYSSIFELSRTQTQVAEFDGELLRTSLRVRRGLGPATDLEMELAGLYSTSGFLDGFVNDFHNATSLFADGGREDFPDDQYAMTLQVGSRTLYELEEDRVGFMDLPITLTHALRREDAHGPAVALRLAVELPTGSEARGFGNGGIDYGTGLLLERSIERWTITGAFDLRVADEPSAFAGTGVEVPPIVSAQNGYEYRWSDTTSVLVHLAWTSPILTGFNAEEVDRDILDLGFGAAWDVGEDSVFALTFHEDVIAATGTDFSVLFAFRSGL